MKQRFYGMLLWMVFASALIVGCAGTPTSTANDQSALCIQGVTAGRKAATALLRAGKLTVEKHHTMQESFNAAVPGCALLAEQGEAR